MAVLRVTNFGGLKPRASARALPADAAQTAHNLQANTREFRPLATDTQVIANTGLTNPLTIFRLQRNSDGSLNTDFAEITKWKVYAGRRSFVKAQVNNDTTDRHYYSFDDGTAAPRVLDATGNDRQLGVPAPTAAPTVSVNETDEFTSEDRATGLQAALALAIKAVQDSASVVWRGAADPGTGTPGYLNRTTANGFATADPSQQVRVYRLASSGGAISDSYTAVDDSAFNWVFDPSLAAITGDSTASTPSWAGTVGTPHICIPYAAYGLTYNINTSTLTTALAAITMPGKTDGTKLFTTPQVTEIVNEISAYADPAGATIQPKIQALAAKVTELRTLLDGGGRTSVVAQTTGFYSKADVVAVARAAWTPENVKGWTAEMLAAHADAMRAEEKRQQELANAKQKTEADHARAKAAIEAAHAELTAEQAVLNDRAQKLSADRMEIARLREEVRKQKPQLAALMEVMEAELPADKG